MTVRAYIHSLKDHEHDRHVLGEAEITKGQKRRAASMDLVEFLR